MHTSRKMFKILEFFMADLDQCENNHLNWNDRNLYLGKSLEYFNPLIEFFEKFRGNNVHSCVLCTKMIYIFPVFIMNQNS